MVKFYFTTIAFVVLANSCCDVEAVRVKRGFGGGFGGDFGYDHFAGSFNLFGGDFTSSPSTHDYSGGKSYNGFVGSASSIAKTAADIAHKAVSNQDLYARQASFSAKSVYAAQAQQAAKTAQAAVAGKQTIIHSLQQAAQEAQEQIGAELHHLEQAQRAAWNAENTAANANRQVASLTAALNHAQADAFAAERAANDAQQEVGSIQRMVVMAKLKAESTSNNLHAAIADLKRSRMEADRAAAFAASSAEKAAHIAKKIATSTISSNHEYTHH